MPRYIRKERLKAAIQAIYQWRSETQSQASKHLFPFLALLEKGVSANDFRKYEESDDFAFHDKYFRVGTDANLPYFDPLTRNRRVASHPHSNVSTARKNTFENRWEAATSRLVNNDEDTEWRLANNFDDIIVQKVMTKSSEVKRPNVLDLAVWLFRQHEFDDTVDARRLEAFFRQNFPMSDVAYHKLFQFNDESNENLFSNVPLTDQDVQEVVTETLIPTAGAPTTPVAPPVIQSALVDDDAILLEVRNVLAINSSGIILRGCPGTGKTWYAWNVALALTDNKPANIFRVQFHSSYGYEDFVEGYRPTNDTKSGFEIVDRVFLKAVEAASNTRDKVVFIIDEINRGDPARIFGEVLTYIEHGWRETTFPVPYSGKDVSIPRNLIMLATMNPHDRSITQLDMALLRRFDQINIAPSGERVDDFLKAAGMSAEHSTLVVRWFDTLQSLLRFGIGHTYFIGVQDAATLATVWRYRILPYCESVLEFEPDLLTNIRNSFDALQARLRGQSGATT